MDMSVQTLEGLMRRFPDRSRLASLRERILSAEPDLELDLEIHRLFSRQASGEFLRVERIVTYRTDGREDYTVDNSEWLWAHGDSIGSVDDNGVTTYWSGRSPEFWDDLWVIPRYTTRVEHALNLKWEILSHREAVTVEEIVSRSEDEGQSEFFPIYKVTVGGGTKSHVSNQGLRSPAKAIVVAVIEYLLLSDEDL
jgi:hypothetical protein